MLYFPYLHCLSSVLIPRFVASWVRPETSPGHSPVTSLSWGPWGNLLVSACPLESCLVVWDVPIGLTTPIHRTRDSGVALVAWSPDGCRVFAGGVSSAFRVWETKSWTNECWADFSGRCKVRTNQTKVRGQLV